MRKRLLSIAMTLSVVTLVSCGKKEKKQVAQLPQSFPVEKVSRKSVMTYEKYAANIEGVQNIEIRPKVDGFIEHIYMDEGASVKKGQLLFTLSAQTLNQRVNAALANVKVAQAKVKAAQVEVTKITPLVEKNIISAIQLETAQSNLAATEAGLAAAKADLCNAKENLAYTEIRSPSNGVVGSIPYKVGSLVGRNEPKPLTTVSNISNVYAYFSLTEKQLLALSRQLKGEDWSEKVKQFPSVSLVLADGSSYDLKGRIETVNGMVNARTGSVRLRAVFANPNKLLRSGSSGVVTMPAKKDNVLTMSQKASYELQGKRFVYVVDHNNKVKSKQVNVGDVVEKDFVVNQGLDEGEIIVCDGLNRLREGMTIVPQGLPSGANGNLSSNAMRSK